MRRNPSRRLERLCLRFIGELHLQRVHNGEIMGGLWQRREDAALFRSEKEEAHPGLRCPIMPSLQQTKSDLVPVTLYQRGRGIGYVERES